jgi:hypothetical protein
MPLLGSRSLYEEIPAAGQPTMRRWEEVPHVGSRGGVFHADVGLALLLALLVRRVARLAVSAGLALLLPATAFAAAGDARPVPIKNSVLRITFPILDADGDLVTAAATLDSECSCDAGTAADCTNEATEIATSTGMYFLDLTAAEMNCDTTVVVVKTSTSGAKTTPIVLYPATSTGEEIPVDVQSWDGTAVPVPNTAGYPIATLKDGTGVGEVDTSAGAVVSVTTCAALTTNNDKAGYALTTAEKEDIRALRTGTADSGTTTTFVDAALTEADADYFRGLQVCFTSGTLLDQCRPVTAFAPATDTVTFSPATTAAVGTHTYEFRSWSPVAIVDGTGVGEIDTLSGAVVNVDLTDTVTTYTGDTPQTGDAFARLGAPAGASVSADIAAVQADTNLYDTDAEHCAAVWGCDATTQQTQGSFGGTLGDQAADADDVWALANSFLDASTSSRATPAQVNAEVLDVLNVDTFAEPGQGAPAATTTLAAKINYLYKAWRNKKTQTSTLFKLFADDAITTDQKATVSDDGTTTTVEEQAAGP